MSRKIKIKTLLLQPKYFLSLGIIFLAILMYIFRQKPTNGFLKAPLFSGWAYRSVFSDPSMMAYAKNDSSLATVNFQYKESAVEFALPLDNTTIGTDKNNSVVFSTPNSSIQVKYTNLSNGIKEDIILNQRPTNSQFISTLKTRNAEIYLNSDKLPVFVDPKTKQYLFHVQKPYAIDAKGHKTFAVTYQLLKNNEPLKSQTPKNIASLLDGLIPLDLTATYSISLKVDPSWLFDPKRSYPITIDPTVVHDTQAEFESGTLNRTLHIGTSEQIYVGIGGSISYSGGYIIHTFYGAGTFTASTGITIDYLAVGGGGGGGVSGNNFVGGGGGGGGVAVGTTSLSVGKTVSITIGSGGIGGIPSSGGNTVFGNIVTAVGGGYGGGSGNAPASGGSGGGRGGQNSILAGGTGTAGQGNNGGPSMSSGDGGAGGGGATGTGNSAPVWNVGGIGGEGYTNSYSGTSRVYGSGGGGGSYTSGGAGGTNGGTGGVLNNGGNPATYYGSGGGGGGTQGGVSRAGGNGYQGIVIIRYPLSYTGITPALADYYQELPTDANTIGLWHMNEAAGTTIADSSGNNFTGTLGTGSSAPTLNVTSNLNVGISFNGTTSFISLGSSFAANVTGNSISVEFWLKPISFAATSTPIHKNNQFSIQIDTNGYVYWADSSNWSFANFGAQNIGLVTGKWQHLAFTKNNGIVNIYLDGVLKVSKVFGGSITASSDKLFFGCYGVNANCANTPYNGLLDEIRISNIARSQEEIKVSASRRPSATYTSSVVDFGAGKTAGAWNSLSWTSGGVNTGDGEILSNGSSLVAQWDLNETSGTISSVTAGSCVGCTGALTNFANTGSQDVGGTNDGWTYNNRRWGQGALVFDGINDYVLVNQNSSINFQQSSPFTIEAWVKPMTTNIAILNKQQNTTNEFVFSLFYDSTNHFLLSLAKQNVLGNNATSAQIYPVGQWYHVVGVSDGSNIYIYVNGILQGTTAITFSSATQSVANLYIGSYYNATSYFNGVIDSTRIYSRILTASEILSNYQAGSLDFQTRVGNSADPNDGTWDDWSPSSGETQINSFDTDIANWAWDTSQGGTTMPVNKYNESTIKLEGSGSMKLALGIAQTDANVVGYWHLDETGTAVGTTFYDSSASANHGIATTVPTIVNGIVSKGRSFNGTDSEIKINSSLGLGTTSVTIEAWANIGSTAIGGAIVKIGNTGSNGFGIGIGNTNFISTSPGNNLIILYEGVRWIGTTQKVSLGWHHFALVINSSGFPAAYFDGVQIYSDSTGAPVAPTTSTYIGGYKSSADNRHFLGTIDEVRISKVARSAEEIAENYRLGRDHYLNKTIASTNLSAKNSLPFYVASDRPGTILNLTVGESAFATYQPDANIVGFWHLDESAGTGSFLKDAGTNKYDASITGTFKSTPGKIGTALFFDGSTSSKLANSTQANMTTGDFTVSTWINGTGIGTTSSVYPMLVSKNDGIGAARNGYNLVLYPGNQPLTPAPYFEIYNSGSGANAMSSTDIRDGQWHYIVGVKTSSTVSIYIDGILQSSNSHALGTISNTAPLTFGNIANSAAAGNYYLPNNTKLDEIRIDNIARTADEIRQAYEVGQHTHSVTIDFAADLDAGNLITASNDYSFTIDATHFGLAQKGSFIFPEDKIIIRENVGGTEYISQGTVNSVTASTGAVTVTSWDVGSSFPSGGYTAGASVFKWQREYFNLNEPLDTHLNTTTNLTLRVINGNEGRTVWLDDLRGADSYLTNSIGSTITSSLGKRYFQYRTIFSTFDKAVSPSLYTVTLDYLDNIPPNIPTLISPTDGSTDQSLTPTLKTVTTDNQSDFVQYKIQICTNAAMTANCDNYDQTNTNVGWSGQDVGTSAFASGTTATYIVQTPLAPATTYYWRSQAIDPAGTNTWGSSQATPFSFTTFVLNPASNCRVEESKTKTSFNILWTDNATTETGYEVQRSANGGAWSVFQTGLGIGTSSLIDSTVLPGGNYIYRIAPYKDTYYAPWCSTVSLSIGNTVNSFKFDGLKIDGLNIN